MAESIEIGRFSEVATDSTMAFEINRPSLSRAAVDARVQGVAADIIASDAGIIAAAEAAVSVATNDAALLHATDLGAVRTISTEDQLYSEVRLSKDFRRVGGALRAGGEVGINPDSTETALNAGNGERLLTKDFRVAQPGGDATGLTPQAVIDEWAGRMASSPAFTALTGLGDSMTTAYGGGLSQTTLTATELGVTGFDRGGSGDTPYEIGFRLGAIPIRITAPGGVIPGNGSVVVTVETPNNAAGWWQARTWQCRLRDTSGRQVEVTLNKAASSVQAGAIGTCTVSRSIPGTDVPIMPGTRIEHAHSYQDNARFAPTIFWIGRNDPHQGRIIEVLEALIGEQRDPARRAMILPLFTRDGSPSGSPTYVSDMAINAAVQQRFPTQFFDSRTALIRGGLQIMGVPPTEADTTAIAEDRIPPTFRPAGDPTHLNDLGRLALAKIHAIEIAARSW